MGNVPKIRFSEYTAEWIEKKLGEIFIQEANFVNPQESGIELWSLTVEDGLTPKTERYERDFLVKKEDKFKEVKPGWIVYNPMNMTLGAVAYNGMNRSVAVSGYYTTMTTAKGTDTYFVNTWLKSFKAIELYKIYATGTLKEKQRVQYSTLSSIPAFFPPLDEQSQIGLLFQKLDTLITLYQRKCNTLEKAKLYFLQNLFPRKGERVPKIRFDGFSGEWEERKLGEIFVEYSDKNHAEMPPLMIIQGSGTVLREESDRNIQYEESSLAGYKLVRAGDFIVHLRSFEGGLEKANTDGIVSPAYHTFHSSIAYTNFYYPYFRSYDFVHRKLKPHVYGIRDGRSIDIDGMKTILIPYTSYEEQKQVGDFLESLTNLAALFKGKHETLLNLKRYLLNNMFV